MDRDLNIDMYWDWGFNQYRDRDLHLYRDLHMYRDMSRDWDLERDWDLNRDLYRDLRWDLSSHMSYKSWRVSSTDKLVRSYVCRP